MPVRRPRLSDLERLAAEHGFRPGDDELRAYQQTIDALLRLYDGVEGLPELLPQVRYPRTPGYRPAPEENSLNAWSWRCAIRGADEGLLAGRRIAIKDNVCVAGVPMLNGSQLIEGYIPEADATVVSRILDAGGTIAGKASCEDLCFSGGSHTARYGPILNPHDPARSAGGSSGGSAALVAAGAVEMAIGGDQGGSIRIPSSWCGVVGFKPTYGLVPYTGAFPVELTLDHLGPIARTVADCALLLEAIAGSDGFDPRQPEAAPVQPYSRLLEGELGGLRVGVLREGFDWEGRSEPGVDAAVLASAERLREAGARVAELSIPAHCQGSAIWTLIAVEGIYQTLFQSNGLGSNWRGAYFGSMGEAYVRGRARYADTLPHAAKAFTILGAYLNQTAQGRFYALGQNLARGLRAAYDAAFERVDLLLMPTTPQTATPLPGPTSDPLEQIERTGDMDANVAQFDVTGHPAISLPCGSVDGRPVGMMLVGRRWEDATVLRAAHAFEQLRSA
jgi:amidase